MAERILPDPITPESVIGLIESGATEGQTIEFKQAIDLSDSEKKLKLCRSVASFANASGGDIVFGAEESKGRIASFIGLHEFDPDKAQLQIRQILNSNIEPNVPGLKFETAEVQPSRPVLILRIPRSWNRPHAIVESGNFPVRDGNRRRYLKPAELRDAFGLSAAIGDRMKRFRAERIGSLLGSDRDLPFTDSCILVTHLMPQSAFDRGQQIDLAHARRLRPKLLGADLGGPRMNFDGVLHAYPSLGFDVENKLRSYVQFFRNGCIEAGMVVWRGPKDERLLYFSYERDIAKAVRSHLELMRALEVEPPIFFGLAFLGMQDFRLTTVGQLGETLSTRPIGTNPLVMPEIALENFSGALEALLKECFDWVWHAVGWNGSPNYDANGRWLPDAR